MRLLRTNGVSASFWCGKGEKIKNAATVDRRVRSVANGGSQDVGAWLQGYANVFVVSEVYMASWVLVKNGQVRSTNLRLCDKWGR